MSEKTFDDMDPGPMTQYGDTSQTLRMDELWEMNMHLNPLDDHDTHIIKHHIQFLRNSKDPFISYIH